MLNLGMVMMMMIIVMMQNCTGDAIGGEDDSWKKTVTWGDVTGNGVNDGDDNGTYSK